MTLTCLDCGRTLKRHGRTGRLIHAAGGAVAACDLDADHPPRPDWHALGEIMCGRCGTPAQAELRGSLRHLDPGHDDHEPTPWATG